MRGSTARTTALRTAAAARAHKGFRMDEAYLGGRALEQPASGEADHQPGESGEQEIHANESSDRPGRARGPVNPDQRAQHQGDDSVEEHPARPHLSPCPEIADDLEHPLDEK